MLQQIFYDLTEISIAVSFVILLACATSKWMSKHMAADSEKSYGWYLL